VTRALSYGAFLFAFAAVILAFVYERQTPYMWISVSALVAAFVCRIVSSSLSTRSIPAVLSKRQDRIGTWLGWTPAVLWIRSLAVTWNSMRYAPFVWSLYGMAFIATLAARQRFVGRL